MNAKVYALISSIVVILLVGCGGMVRQQTDDINTKYDDKLAADPIVQRLKGKILLPPEKNWSLEQLSNNTYPSPAEKEAILVADRIINEYHDEFLKALSNNNRGAEFSLANDLSSAQKDNRLALFQGKVTYGEFNQQAKKIYTTYASLHGKLAQMNAEQARQAWASAFQSAGNSFNTPRRTPTNTNCINLGTTISCTSN